MIEARLTADAGKAALRITDLEIEELSARQDAFEAALVDRDTGDILRQNSEFHHLHIEASDNPEAANVMERHWSLLQTMRIRSGYTVSAALITLRWHSSTAADR